MRIKIVSGQAYEIVKEMPGGVMLRGITELLTGELIIQKSTDLIQSQLAAEFKVMPSEEKQVVKFP